MDVSDFSMTRLPW